MVQTFLNRSGIFIHLIKIKSTQDQTDHVTQPMSNHRYQLQHESMFTFIFLSQLYQLIAIGTNSSECKAHFAIYILIMHFYICVFQNQ